MGILYISAFIVGLSGAMMPGSLLTYTLKEALSKGPSAGFVIIIGHALLELVLVILIFLGFDMVLQSNAAQIGIGIIGGVLLCYMGVNMIKDALKDNIDINTDKVGSDKKGTRGLVASGAVISLANPYFLLWWAVIGLGFIMQSYDSLGYQGVAIYYLGHISADFIWYGLVSILVGKTRSFIKEKPYRIIIAVLGCVLIFFGVKFLYEAIINLMVVI